jgi:hypothetical protein
MSTATAFDASLRCAIGIEIRCDHVVVGIAQCIHKRSEPAGIGGGKDTGLDRPDGFGQLGRLCNRHTCLRGRPPTLLDLLCPQAEDEDVLWADMVANFDIRPARIRSVSKEKVRKLDAVTDSLASGSVCN